MSRSLPNLKVTLMGKAALKMTRIHAINQFVCRNVEIPCCPDSQRAAAAPTFWLKDNNTLEMYTLPGRNTACFNAV